MLGLFEPCVNDGKSDLELTEFAMDGERVVPGTSVCPVLVGTVPVVDGGCDPVEAEGVSEVVDEGRVVNVPVGNAVPPGVTRSDTLGVDTMDGDSETRSPEGWSDCIVDGLVVRPPPLTGAVTVSLGAIVVPPLTGGVPTSLGADVIVGAPVTPPGALGILLRCPDGTSDVR